MNRHVGWSPSSLSRRSEYSIKDMSKFTLEILDKIKIINSCLNEFISIEDIETEIIESMKDIKKEIAV